MQNNIRKIHSIGNSIFHHEYEHLTPLGLVVSALAQATLISFIASLSAENLQIRYSFSLVLKINRL